MSAQDPTNRITRWVMHLQQYDFEIDHRPGTANGNADGLSRAPVNPATPEEEDPGRTALVMVTLMASDPDQPPHLNSS